MSEQHRELPVEKLRLVIDPGSLPFESTASLKDLEFKAVGQERAVDAIRFGVQIKKKGYNLFIAGPPKSGLASIARAFVEEQAGGESRPPDWCYVHNFRQKDNPKAISLGAGRGTEFKTEMERLVKTIQDKIPEVFMSHEFGTRDAEIHADFERVRQQLIEALAEEGRAKGFVLQFSQMGMALTPAGPSGQPMTQEELANLTPEDLS